jgi:hypothetical protein
VVWEGSGRKARPYPDPRREPWEKDARE